MPRANIYISQAADVHIHLADGDELSLGHYENGDVYSLRILGDQAVHIYGTGSQLCAIGKLLIENFPASMFEPEPEEGLPEDSA